MPSATFPSADNKGFAQVAPVVKRGLRNTLCTAPRAGIVFAPALCLPRCRSWPAAFLPYTAKSRRRDAGATEGLTDT